MTDESCAYIGEMVEGRPEILSDRFGLSFTKQTAPLEIADALAGYGMVMLREAISEKTLRSCRKTFSRFTCSLGQRRPASRLWTRSDDDGPDKEWANGEANYGSWHRPWVVRYGNDRPAAVVIAALLNSWVWPVVETICGTTDIVILLSLCMARHNVDIPLGIGAHQDATAVADDVPFSIWIPLHDVLPRQASGLGFVVPAPDVVLPTPSPGDVGRDYILQNLDKTWVPTYRAGDFTIHTKYCPHFTTGFGTRSDRYSFEIRAMARAAAPPSHLDPAIYVSRREGIPVVTGTNCSPGTAAREFLASFKQARAI